MIEFIKFLFDILVPRFIEERVCLAKNDNDEWYVVCAERFEQEEDSLYIEKRGTMKTFTWLGFASGGPCKMDK